MVTINENQQRTDFGWAFPLLFTWADAPWEHQVNLYVSNRGLFYLHGLTLIPAWISNHLPRKVWDEITYPFLNFNGCTVEV